MYYYKKENEEIVKYQIILDEDTLKKLRSEIIEKCSVITHHCFKTTNPVEKSINHRNYRKTKIGIKTYDNPPDTYNYHPDEDEYLVEYDY